MLKIWLLYFFKKEVYLLNCYWFVPNTNRVYICKFFRTSLFFIRSITYMVWSGNSNCIFRINLGSDLRGLIIFWSKSNQDIIISSYSLLYSVILSCVMCHRLHQMRNTAKDQKNFEWKFCDIKTLNGYGTGIVNVNYSSWTLLPCKYFLFDKIERFNTCEYEVLWGNEIKNKSVLCVNNIRRPWWEYMIYLLDFGSIAPKWK